MIGHPIQQMMVVVEQQVPGKNGRRCAEARLHSI